MAVTNVPITIVIPTTCRYERADLLRSAGLASLAALDDAEQIARLLDDWLQGQLVTTHADPAAVGQASRASRTAALAAQFDRIARGDLERADA